MAARRHRTRSAGPRPALDRRSRVDAARELPQFLAGRREFFGEISDLVSQVALGRQGLLQGAHAQPQRDKALLRAVV